MKKILTLMTLLCLLNCGQAQSMQQQEFDPVKALVVGVFTTITPLIRTHQSELLLAGSAVSTIALAGAGFYEWYNQNQECKQLHQDLLKYAAADCTNVNKTQSQTYTFYHQLSDYVQNTQLGILIAEFELLYQQKNKVLLDKKYREISMYVAEQRSLLF